MFKYTPLFSGGKEPQIEEQDVYKIKILYEGKTNNKPTTTDSKLTIINDKASAILYYLNEHQTARTEELAKYINLSTS